MDEGTHMENLLNKEWRDEVIRALNEHGFLFQQRVKETIREHYSTSGETSHPWKLLAAEYPVTATDGRQTRIDLVLDNRSGMYLSVECKRSHPDYKVWAFFDSSPTAGHRGHDELFIETVTTTQRPVERPEHQQHCIANMDTSCPCFNLYVEVKLDTAGRASSTERIEDAFSQAMFGQSGLMRKVYSFDDQSRFAVVPVVVTSAQLVECVFDISRVSADAGMLQSKDIKLRQHEYLAVNYHASDSLALNTELGHIPQRRSIEDDLVRWQMRTVFVVQANSLTKFLCWLADQVNRNRIRF